MSICISLSLYIYIYIYIYILYIHIYLQYMYNQQILELRFSYSEATVVNWLKRPIVVFFRIESAIPGF